MIPKYRRNPEIHPNKDKAVSIEELQIIELKVKPETKALNQNSKPKIIIRLTQIKKKIY